MLRDEAEAEAEAEAKESDEEKKHKQEERDIQDEKTGSQRTTQCALGLR